MGTIAIVILLLLVAPGRNTGEQLCTHLFKEGNQKGDKYSMLDDSYVADFQEEYITAETVWNSTSSFSLEEGCTLTACNDSYFNGDCRQFSQSLELLPQGFETILSARCACFRVCSCSDIHIRSTSCGHAYLSEGCNVCNSYYQDLRDENGYIVSWSEHNVTSFKVRKGCNLIIYTEKRFKGERYFINNTVDLWNGAIGSYNCSCPSGCVSSIIKPQRPLNYSALLNIPYSIENVCSMLNGEFKEHPGLKAALKSLKNKRSSKNVYILVVGSTGAGKTTAIKLLFDNPNITIVEEDYSTTADINEFRVNIPVDELGIQNSELRIIDTPGLGDMRGLEQDAKFLANLDEYLSNHEELHERIPNVVLIFHKFSDQRYGRGESVFVKMLRGMNEFRKRITDENYSNVIFVFSHFMSETKAIRRNPKKRLLAVKDIIEGYTLFPKPIVMVVAENKAAMQQIPSVNGYYKLPNGDLYPKNLFDKIQEATTRGGDPIGEAVIRTAFNDSDTFKISASTYKLVKSGNRRTSKYYNILFNAFYKVENTEISQMLTTAHAKMGIALNNKYPESLLTMQRALNVRNMRTKANIPQTTLGILELLSTLKLDEANTFLLAEGLKIKPPVFDHNVLTAHSYNVFKDIPHLQSPFQLDEEIYSNIGYLLPSVITCSVENQVSDFVKFFPSKIEYLKDRLSNFGIQDKIGENQFSGVIKPGFNIQSDTLRDGRCEITAMREFRTFKLTLNDQAPLAEHFISALLGLSDFSNSDAENIDVWNDFFDEYGTHVVSSVYGGGAIEIHLKSNTKCNAEMITALLDIVKFAEDVNVCNDNSSAFLQGEGVRHVLKFRGGDQAYHTTDLTKLIANDAYQLLTNWRKSIRFNPIILTSEIKLIPISTVARNIDQMHNISLEIDRVASLRFNSSLRYIPSKTTSSNGNYIATTGFSTTLIVTGITIIAVFVILSIIFAWIYLNRYRKLLCARLTPDEIQYFLNGRPELVSNNETANTNAQNLAYDINKEIELKDLDIDCKTILGSGEFGIVFKGYLKTKDTVVAIKTVKAGSSADCIKSAMVELKVMLFIKEHENVVGVIGACTKDLMNNQLNVVMEYCDYGNLLNYLRKNAKHFINQISKGIYLPTSKHDIVPVEILPGIEESNLGHMSTSTLIHWSLQIANGMKYISSMNVIHGDLAARNILLDANLTAKISDFGLSKKLYQHANYTRKKNVPLPWRWLAVESLNFTEFSQATDVWAFAITLWEIFSLGKTPYAGQEYNDEFIRMLTNGFRLGLPEFSSYEIYTIIQDCWEKDPAQRPNFIDIHRRFDAMTGIYAIL